MEQQAQIAEKLKGFDEARFDLAVVTGDPEALDLLVMIEYALTTATWPQISWDDNGGLLWYRVGHPLIGTATITNIVIQMHQEKVPELSPAAFALATALNDEGIDAKVERSIYRGL